MCPIPRTRLHCSAEDTVRGWPKQHTVYPDEAPQLHLSSVPEQPRRPSREHDVGEAMQKPTRYKIYRQPIDFRQTPISQIGQGKIGSTIEEERSNEVIFNETTHARSKQE